MDNDIFDKIENEKLTENYVNKSVKFLHIGTVIGNAFIEVMQQTSGALRSLNMYDIMDYAEKIENFFEENRQKVVVEIDHDKLESFMNNYRNYLSFDKKNHQISLKDGVTTENLINQFRWNISDDLVKTFSNKEFINQCFLKEASKISGKSTQNSVKTK